MLWKFRVRCDTWTHHGETQWRKAQLPPLAVVGADARRDQETASVEDKHPKEVWTYSCDNTQRRVN